VVIGDWLRSLKLFWDLHILQHVNKYVNEPETTPKQSQNVLELFQCFVSHVRASETKHCFGFVLCCFVSVVRAALHCLYLIRYSENKQESAGLLILAAGANDL